MHQDGSKKRELAPAVESLFSPYYVLLTELQGIVVVVAAAAVEVILKFTREKAEPSAEKKLTYFCHTLPSSSLKGSEKVTKFVCIGSIAI